VSVRVTNPLVLAVVVLAYQTVLTTWLVARPMPAETRENVSVGESAITVSFPINENTEIWLDGKRLAPAQLGRVDPRHYYVDDCRGGHGLLTLGLLSKKPGVKEAKP
jgi:hypothetical protein